MRKETKHRTDFLTPRTSFIVGMGSVLNIAGNYFIFNYSSSGEEADEKALRSDWGMIGQDINNAKREIFKKYNLKALN